MQDLTAVVIKKAVIIRNLRYQKEEGHILKGTYSL
jgi:hypothetical protein